MKELKEFADTFLKIASNKLFSLTLIVYARTQRNKIVFRGELILGVY